MFIVCKRIIRIKIKQLLKIKFPSLVKGAAGSSPTQGGEDVKVGEKISEVDKEWFGIQIKSLEEKLDRRNAKLR